MRNNLRRLIGRLKYLEQRNTDLRLQLILAKADMARWQELAIGWERQAANWEQTAIAAVAKANALEGKR